MILEETDRAPESFEFDAAIVAIGYERRCRWITQRHDISANRRIGLEFGFMQEASYNANRNFFEERGYCVLNGLDSSAVQKIAAVIEELPTSKPKKIFIDVSAMSREMIANVILAVQRARGGAELLITAGYAPSKYRKPRGPAPIRFAEPVNPVLAGWSTRPEMPLGAIFGLGGEPGLALGALQVLEPDKTWVFAPRGVDPRYDRALISANEHIEDIFDVTKFEYSIENPSITRGRFEALLNSVSGSFRLVAVPFGPKIFAWLVIATSVFNDRRELGVWAFSSRDQGALVDLDADGTTIWHTMRLALSTPLA